MSDLQIEVTVEQRDQLLRGLRFVRSATMLETRDHTPEDAVRRAETMKQIKELADHLKSAPSVSAAEV